MPSKIQQLAIELEQELNLRVNETLVLPELEKILIDKGHMLPEQAGGVTYIRDALLNVVDMVDILKRERDRHKADAEYYRKEYHDMAYGPEIDEEPVEQVEAVEQAVDPAPPEPEMPIQNGNWRRLGEQLTNEAPTITQRDALWRDIEAGIETNRVMMDLWTRNDPT